MFPALASNDYAYLNSGGSGPPPYYVTEAMRAADDLCAGPAYLEGVRLYARQAETCSRAREAARPNTPDAWCRSTSSGSASGWR
jgi:hypothetical protein